MGFPLFFSPSFLMCLYPVLHVECSCRDSKAKRRNERKTRNKRPENSSLKKQDKSIHSFTSQNTRAVSYLGIHPRHSTCPIVLRTHPPGSCVTRCSKRYLHFCLRHYSNETQKKRGTITKTPANLKSPTRLASGIQNPSNKKKESECKR